MCAAPRNSNSFHVVNHLSRQVGPIRNEAVHAPGQQTAHVSFLVDGPDLHT
jgi:hypothetical protein